MGDLFCFVGPTSYVCVWSLRMTCFVMIVPETLLKLSACNKAEVYFSNREKFGALVAAHKKTRENLGMHNRTPEKNT